MAFGSGFKLPVLVKFAMPNPEPNSRSANITESWFVDVGGK